MKISKKTGIILILIGTFIPSFLYPFTRLSSDAFAISAICASKGIQYKARLHQIEIVIREGTYQKHRNEYFGKYEGRINIPYSYFVAGGIFIIFIGISIIALNKDRKWEK